MDLAVKGKGFEEGINSRGWGERAAEDGWLLPSIILILNPGHVSLWDEEEFGREEGVGLIEGWWM